MRSNDRIICVGGANVDRKAISDSTIVPGDSNPVRISIGFGGVARNIADNLVRLGVPTSLCTAVGDDPDGRRILEDLRRRGVGTDMLSVVPEASTGSYTALIDPEGELKVAFVDMEIMEHLTSELLDRYWHALAASEFVVIDANLPEETLRNVIRRCREQGVPLCVNPVSSVKMNRLPADLRGVRLLIANRNEAETYTGRSIRSADDAVRAAAALLRCGAGQVVITLGGEGLVWADETGSGHLLPPHARVVDVTGAGDALMAGVLFGLLDRQSLAEACRWGMRASARTIQSHGTVVDLDPDYVRGLKV